MIKSVVALLVSSFLLANQTADAAPQNSLNLKAEEIGKIVCTSESFDAEKVIDFPGSGYWMQAGGDLITHTASGGTEAAYFNPETKKNVVRKADVDPYPLPEGDLIIHPSLSSGGREGLRFFKTSDVIEKGNQAKPIYMDQDHLGWYESAGIVDRDISHRTARVLTANGTGKIQDYSIMHNRDSSYEIKPTFPHPIPACQNMDRSKLDWETPILSKDGKFIATRGTVEGSGTTKVYSLSIPSGDCKLIADLGVETDKVSFRGDSKKIAYITSVKHGADFSPQLYEYDVESKTSRLVSVPSENVLFQGYKPDGTLMYTRSKGPGDADEVGSEMVFLSKNWHESESRDTQAAAKMIGRIWGKRCSNDVDDDQAIAIGSRLRNSQCTNLAKQYGDLPANLKDSKIATSNLVSFCGKTATSATGRRTVQ